MEAANGRIRIGGHRHETGRPPSQRIIDTGRGTATEAAGPDGRPHDARRHRRAPGGHLRLLYAFFRRDLAQANNRLASISTDIYASRYGDIQYRVVGDGPAVLISHGITGGVDAGEYLVTRWRNLPEDYRFIYVSRFGYLGSSMPEDATPQLQAAAYRDLLDHLGIERAFIVANSAGGAAGMWFAIDYPERTSGLILLSSAVPGPLADPIPGFVAENDFVYWARSSSPPTR